MSCLKWCRFSNFFLMFIFEKEKKRQSIRWGGAEREGDTESEAGYRLWVVNVGLKPTWDHDLSQSWMLNWLNHPGIPGVTFLDGSAPSSCIFPFCSAIQNNRVSPSLFHWIYSYWGKKSPTAYFSNLKKNVYSLITLVSHVSFDNTVLSFLLCLIGHTSSLALFLLIS